MGKQTKGLTNTHSVDEYIRSVEDYYGVVISFQLLAVKGQEDGPCRRASFTVTDRLADDGERHLIAFSRLIYTQPKESFLAQLTGCVTVIMSQLIDYRWAGIRPDVVPPGELPQA